MGLIAGIINYRNQLDFKTSLHGLKKSVAHRVQHLELFRTKNALVVAEGTLAPYLDRRAWLSVDGQIDSLLVDLDSPDFESTLIRTQLAGDFALAYFDSLTDQVYLRRDILGTKPLFYFHDSGQAIWASELKTIVAILGYSSEKIKRVQPGHSVLLGPTGIKIFEVDQLRLSERSIPAMDACEEFKFLLSSSIEQKTRHSSSVFLNSNGPFSHAVIATSKDPQILSEKFKSEPNLDEPMELQLWITESPIQEKHWARKAMLFKRAKSLGYNAVVTGSWGRGLMDRHTVLSLLAHTNWTDFLSQLLGIGTQPKEVHQIGLLGFISNHRHHIENQSKIAAYFGVRLITPFLDRQLIEFLLSVSVKNSQQTHGQLFLDYICKNSASTDLHATELDQWQSDDDLWKREFEAKFFERLSQFSADDVSIRDRTQEIRQETFAPQHSSHLTAGL